MKKLMGIFLLASLAACGSGSSSNNGGAESTSNISIGANTLKGVASTGDALAAASIQAWDSTGKLLASGVTDSLGNYQLSVGEYSPPLLLKATANGGNQVYYHVVFEPASSKGLRVNINQVTDLLVEQYLHSIQANTNNPLENNFPQIAPRLNASMYRQARETLDKVIGPLASSIAVGDESLSNTLNKQSSVTEALVRGLIEGPSHTGLDNLLDQLHIQKTATLARLSFPAVPYVAPVDIPTDSLSPDTGNAVKQAKSVTDDPSAAAQLQAAPPTVVIGNLTAWASKANNGVGYSGAIALWVPKAVAGGWTLSFQSPGLVKQVADGVSFTNAVATVNKGNNTITLNNAAANGTLAANDVVAIGFSVPGVMDGEVDFVNCRFNGRPCALVAQTAKDANRTLESLLKNFRYSSAERSTIAGKVATALTAGRENAGNGNGPAPGQTENPNMPSTPASPLLSQPTAQPNAQPNGGGDNTPAAPAPAAAPLTITFVIPSAIWDGGYPAEMRIKNTSAATLAAGANGWQAQIKFPSKAIAMNVFDGGPWNCNAAIADDGTVTVTPKDWSAALAPASVFVCGFTGKHLPNLLQATPLDNKKLGIVFDGTISKPPVGGQVPQDKAPGTPGAPATPAPGGTTVPAVGTGFNAPALTVPARPGASSFSLKVKGWGDKLEMGTVLIPEASKDQLVADSGLKTIFKYAGDGGDGDPGAIYFGTKWGNAFYPEATKKIFDLAQRVAVRGSTSSGPLTKVRTDLHPVMVVYTAQLSGGPTAVQQDLLDIPAGASAGDTEFLRDHYANLIIETALMLGYKTASNPYPGSLVMNPDMLGALQQGNVVNGMLRNADGSWVKVNVRAKLQNAIDYVYAKQASAAAAGYNLVLPANKPVLPADLTDDIKGWFQSQNWVVKTFGQDAIGFGWQLNLWAQGSSFWVHGMGGDKNKPHSEDSIWSESAGQVAAFLDFVGVYKGNYVPDFVVFDRYEFDDFREAARNINYAYDAQDWANYLTFVKQVSDYLQRPAMLWQIPASHLLTTGEAVPSSNYIALHSGTGGSYFMGDPLLGVGAVNAAASMKSIPLNGQPYYAGKTNVGDWLSLNPSYDWTYDQLQRAINSNVFSILWGGGNTTGVIETANTGNDGGWMLGRVQGYYLNGGGKPLTRSGGSAAAGRRSEVAGVRREE